MTKITIPVSEIPNISDKSLSHLRYRIIDENRKLFSSWSVISAVKREQFDFTDTSYDNVFRMSASANSNNTINLTWYTNDVTQKFEIYARYRYINAASATYWDETTYFGTAATNSFSFIPAPTLKSGVILTSRSVQALLKVPIYSPVENNKISISTLSRGVDGIATYTTSSDHGLVANDYVSIFLNPSTTTTFDTFAGYFKVISAPTTTTFTCNTVDTTSYTGAPPSGTLNNYVQKISGRVQFITNKVNFL